MVKQLVRPALKLNEKKVLGKYLDEADYDILIQSDTDCTVIPEVSVGDSGEMPIAFKFRKGWFTQEEQDNAYAGLREAATESQNRGLAAGPRGAMLAVEGRGGRDWVTGTQEAILAYFLDERSKPFGEVETLQLIRDRYEGDPISEESRGRVWLRKEVCKVYPEYHGWFDKWADDLEHEPKATKIREAKKVNKEWISVTNYAKSVFSGVAGYFDRYPRIPYGRPCSYTRDNPEKFARCFPFMRSLDRGYRELVPDKWEAQRAAADSIDPNFLVDDTVFTTITVNKTFRTAAHRDAGDLNTGFSNLLTVGSSNYDGGYLILPEIRVAIDVRPGDLLLVNNHEFIHGNTEITPHSDKDERISLVCYFREAMQSLGSWRYEETRRKFVDHRRLDKNHKHQRELWNGISPGMWSSPEWKDYLFAHLDRSEFEKIEAENLKNWEVPSLFDIED